MNKDKTQKIVKLSISALLAGTILAFLVFFINANTNDIKTIPPEVIIEALQQELKVHEISKVEIGSMGDLLIHAPVIRAFYQEQDKSYNFSEAFTYLKPSINKLDYGVIDMEGTLASENFSGYPVFRCPDSLIDAAKECGFDLFLTANNHTNDNGNYGFKRTMRVLGDKGVSFIGTRPNIEDKKYVINTINKIKIGMVNYTYGVIDNQGIAYVNGVPLTRENSKLINIFDYNRLNEFYKEQENIIEEMQNQGVDKIVYYMHWGTEYQIKENDWQRKIAQKLCDLGVDVIVGGHPHVVQPMDVLHSDISGKDTICIYSVGNAISNQRRELMDLKTGHTEDGVLFKFTFSKYSDGNVIVSDVSAVPTWVNMYYKKDGKKTYQILPLDKEKSWKEEFNLDEEMFNNASKSYERTMNIVSSGQEKANDVVKTNISKYKN